MLQAIVDAAKMADVGILDKIFDIENEKLDIDREDELPGRARKGGIRLLSGTNRMERGRSCPLRPH